MARDHVLAGGAIDFFYFLSLSPLSYLYLSSYPA